MSKPAACAPSPRCCTPGTAGSLARLFQRPTADLRRTLLAVNGIGPETADSILLYAANRPVFVVDAYTRRLTERHGWTTPRADYDDVAHLFTRVVPASLPVYNEYHALLVALGKRYCRPTPALRRMPAATVAAREGEERNRRWTLMNADSGWRGDASSRFIGIHRRPSAV
jgi:endonuclease III